MVKKIRSMPGGRRRRRAGGAGGVAVESAVGMMAGRARTREAEEHAGFVSAVVGPQASGVARLGKRGRRQGWRPGGRGGGGGVGRGRVAGGGFCQRMGGPR